MTAVPSQLSWSHYEHILKEGKLTTTTSQALKPVEPEEVFKDVYNFEFLELKKDYKEKKKDGGQVNYSNYLLNVEERKEG
jgi:predicted nuclease of restriction endonuclease-like (RecB) superfamily